MSVERPESISRPVTLLARAASLGMGAIGIGLAVSGAGVGFGATMSIATAVTGWMMTNKADEARNYNEARLEAIKTAERTGEAPHLPKNPFLDPKKQPHPLLTKAARYLAGAAIIIGIAAGATALFGLLPGATLTPLPALLAADFLPVAVQQASMFAVAATASIGGATLLKMASVAESTRRFAEYEVAHHATHREDDLELTHTQEVEAEQSQSTSYNYDVASHPANQPQRKSFVASLFEERGLAQSAQQER